MHPSSTSTGRKGALGAQKCICWRILRSSKIRLQIYKFSKGSQWRTFDPFIPRLVALALAADVLFYTPLRRLCLPAAPQRLAYGSLWVGGDDLCGSVGFRIRRDSAPSPHVPSLPAVPRKRRTWARPENPKGRCKVPWFSPAAASRLQSQSLFAP